MIGVDQDKVSIHSTSFVPRINAKVLGSHDVFGVLEMVTKVFVSERFRDLVERQGLVGLQFREVVCS